MGSEYGRLGSELTFNRETHSTTNCCIIFQCIFKFPFQNIGKVNYAKKKQK